MTSRRVDVMHLSTVHHGHDNRIRNKECQALAREGIEVVLAISAPEPSIEGGVRIVPLTRQTNRIKRLVLGQIEAWRVVSSWKPRVLHIHDPELIPMAWLWARTHRAAVIYDAHEDLVGQIATKPYLPKRVKPLVRAFAKLLISLADRSVDAVVAATEDVAAGYDNPRTIVVRNHPWVSDFSEYPHPVPGRVVYAGDLTEERKLSFMIDIVRRAREQVPNAHLVLAGRALGKAQDVVAREVDGTVIQHVGLLPPAEVPAFMATGQVGLIMLAPLPNYLNSAPTKLFEYMASGVPFLASDFPLWRERFEGCQAGTFTDTEDPDKAAADLTELLASPGLCAALGHKGRFAVEEDYAFEDEAPALVQLTRDLIAQRP